ncbi:MAG: M48 family metalloprotease [Gammaproteobacteria bacterium]
MNFRYASRLLPLLIIAMLASACSTNPVTGKQDFVLMSEEQEISLGRQYSAEIVKEIRVYDDPELTSLVQKIGEQLAANSHRPDLIYRFSVLDSDQVNAFALPGGYIYITRGMMAYLNSEAELAAVLGHEIGHVTARHSVRQHGTATMTGLLGAVLSASTGIQGAGDLSRLAGTAVVRGYGREHELEADRLGAEYLAMSGYNPEGMLEVVGILKNQEAFDKRVAKQEGREPRAYHGLFSTHPDNDKRFQEVVAAANKFRPANTSHIGRDSYLRAIDGLVFGDSEHEGITRNNRFYHRELDFALTFPAGWRIENKSDRVLAIAPENAGIVQLTITDLNKRISPQAFMQQRMKLQNMRSGKPIRVDGLQGYTAIANGKTPWGTRRVRYAVLFRGDKAWVFAGAAKNRNEMQDYEPAIVETIESYHALTDKEKKLAAGKRIRLITATPRTRYSNLARKSPVTHLPEDQLRLLNGHYPDGEPAPSSLIKIVR